VTRLKKQSHYAIHQLLGRRNGAVQVPIIPVTPLELGATKMGAMGRRTTKETAQVHDFIP